MSRTLVHNGIAGPPRRVVEDGVEYLVAPIVSIVPGILPGSQGRLLYTDADVSRDVKQWDRVGLLYGHPQDPITGQHLSANDKGVYERQGLGKVRDSTFDGRLKHFAWVDVARTRKISPSLLAKVESGQPIEVSTGLYTKNSGGPGIHHGEPYDAIARDHTADHIAVLEHATGACSTDSGCGLNVNRQMVFNMGTPPRSSTMSIYDKARAKAALASSTATSPVENQRAARLHGEAGDLALDVGKVKAAGWHYRKVREHTANAGNLYADKQSELQSQLAARFGSGDSGMESGPNGGIWISDMSDDAVIYSKGNRYYRLGYAEKDGKCVLAPGQPAEVKRVTTYDPVSNAAPGIVQPRHTRTGKFLPNDRGSTVGEVHEAATRGFGHTVGSEQPSPEDPDDDGDIHPEIGQGDRPPVELEPEPYGDQALDVGEMGDELELDDDMDPTQGRGKDLRRRDNPTGTQNAEAEHVANADEELCEEECEGDEECLEECLVTENCDMAKNPTSNEGMDPTDPHDASKATVAAAAASEHGEAREAALGALDASGDDKSRAAARGHVKAAETHEGAATQSRADGDDAAANEHDNAAALHRKAASMHAATLNQRKIKAGLQRLDTLITANCGGKGGTKGVCKGGGISKGANAASSKAASSGKAEDHLDAATTHDNAAKFHQGRAAELRKTGGNEAAAKAHDAMAQGHSAQATDHEQMAGGAQHQGAAGGGVQTPVKRGGLQTHQQGEPMTKEQAVAKLTANCKCEADKQALNSLSEAMLLQLAQNTAGVIGDPKEVKRQGGDNKIASGPDSDDDAEDAEEQTKAHTPDTLFTRGAGTQNRQTEAQYVAQLPPRLQTVLNRALVNERKEHQQLVEQLTANAATPERRAQLTAYYGAKPLEELQLIVESLPTQNYAPHEPYSPPSFVGANGAPAGQVPTENYEGDGVDMSVPAVPWKEWSDTWTGGVRAG